MCLETQRTNATELPSGVLADCYILLLLLLYMGSTNGHDCIYMRLGGSGAYPACNLAHGSKLTI